MIEPDLKLVTRLFTEAGADFVLIGGFAVIAHQVMRTTEDCDFLIPDDEDNDSKVLSALEALGAVPRNGQPLTLSLVSERDSLHLESPTSGQLDLLRGGLAPLDFASVSSAAIKATLSEVDFKVASLASLVAFKRLAGRPQDLADLAQLEAIHGPLPEA